jgi:hypothetical protein
MSATTKSITLTGNVYTPSSSFPEEEEAGQHGGRQSRRRRRGQRLQGGGEGSMATPSALTVYREPMGYQTPTAPHAHGAPLPQAFRPVIPPSAVIPVAASAAPIPQAFQYGGMTREVKVNLHSKHRGGSTTSRKVHLKPKRPAAEGGQKKLKSRHKTRKITLGLVSLAKRQTRAKKIKQKVAEMPLPELRAHLVKRGLIKEHSKAPESILRQIAADAQIVAGGDI